MSNVRILGISWCRYSSHHLNGGALRSCTDFGATLDQKAVTYMNIVKESDIQLLV